MRKTQANVPSRTIAADGQQNVGSAHHASRVSAVTYTPEATITGANTDTRKVSLVNKGQDGTGTTEIAALTFTAGVNAPADKKKALTLSTTHGNRAVQPGDVLKFVSTHLGSGLVDPGGLVEVEIR